jgi:hypothetical protein
MTKSLLSTLKVIARPKSGKDDPVIRRREKLLAKLDQQLAMANALVNNETYTAYREKWQKNPETGQKEKVKLPKQINPWFYKRNNEYFMEIRYSNKTIELSKGSHAISVGELDNLTKTISTVIDAVIAGELDDLLENVTTNLSKIKK